MFHKEDNKFIYFGLFIVSATVLVLEISLTRLLSVITWYHLAFFAISTGLLGLTTGAVTVYLRPKWFDISKLYRNVAITCLFLSIAIPISLILILLIPIHHSFVLMGFFSVIVVTIVCIVPFYFAGIVISAVITKTNLSIGKIYASDLFGAGFGCLIALIGLELLSTTSLILLCSTAGAVSAISFALYNFNRRLIRISIVMLVILTTFSVFNNLSKFGIRPIIVKERIELVENIFLERWNSYSRILVLNKVSGAPQISSPSPITPQDISNIQYPINIDGNAGTNIREYSEVNDIDHLRYDGTNTAYRLQKNGDVCIIGIGGGKDILGALLFGYNQIIGIDVNRVFIDLLENDFREFAGIADQEGVTLVADEARSYFARHELTCAIIQMSLVDTWAATGAGAFSLTENGLYTIEAWTIFLERLTDDGIFTVSRWYNPDTLGETGRLVSLALATLIEEGVDHPENHIALITSGNIATLLVNKQPFSQEEIDTLRGLISEYQFGSPIFPGVTPENDLLKGIMASRTIDELRSVTKNAPYNFNPPTDETPYFFNLLKLDNIGIILNSSAGVIRGNSIAILTLVALLVSLILLTITFIVIPLILKRRIEKTNFQSTLWSGALYFALIGAGFMFIEISLIQRLSVFLGHPIYALGILLFTIITSAGLGSFISEYLPLTRSPWVYIFPVLTVVFLLLIIPLLSMTTSNLEHIGIWEKALVSIGLIAPIGMLLGFFFPTGMRLFKRAADSETPWYWALNSIFGVLASALAVLISIFLGISTNILIAVACYGFVIIPILDITRRIPNSSVKPSKNIAD